jgi:hypothetical protein
LSLLGYVTFYFFSLCIGKDAGNAYVKAAELYKTAPDLHYESSKSFENAAKCLKRIDAEGKQRG